MARLAAVTVTHPALVELSVLRPLQWLHFLALPLVGMSFATLTAPSSIGPIALALCCAAAALGWAYGLPRDAAP